MSIPKDYIDDGAYAEWNGYALILTTSNGIHDTNRIEFDSRGIAILERYIAKIKAVAAESKEPPPEPVPPEIENFAACVNAVLTPDTTAEFECRFCDFTGDGAAAADHRMSTGHLIRTKATGDLRRAEGNA